MARSCPTPLNAYDNITITICYEKIEVAVGIYIA
jgi:hypothetical protein